MPSKYSCLAAAIALTLPISAYQVSQAQSDQEVTITFNAKVGEQDFACGESYSGLGTSETTMTPTDFRFYVSNVALIDASGNAVPLTLEQDGKWQYQNIALLDFENKTGPCANGTAETRNQVVGTVPPGEYQGLQFTLGVPSELNHEDATLAPSPLNLTSMWWNWRGGYKFVRVDLDNQSTAMNGEATKEEGMSHEGHSQEHQGHSAQGFAIHIGSTGCEAETDNQQPSSCSNPNLSTIVFDSFDREQNIVIADLANLVAQSNLETNEPDTPVGCMSSPEDGDCLSIMHQLGLPFAEEPSQEQTFFRVE